MKSRILKPVAAIVLAVGLATVSVATPASAAVAEQASGPSTNDTGWGKK